MNTFANPFLASNPFGFSNAFATPASFGSCGTMGFPGTNSFGGSPIGFGAPVFQNPWNSPVGQWINTTPTTPTFGYANAPTGWTNGLNSRFGAFNGQNTNGFLNQGVFGGLGALQNPTLGQFGGFNGLSPYATAWNTPFGWNNTGLLGNTWNTLGASLLTNPALLGSLSPLAGLTSGFTNPMFSGVQQPWNGLFNQPYALRTPWLNQTAWNWSPTQLFNTPSAWGTLPSFFGATPFGFGGNMPSFNPAFFSGLNPNAFSNQGIPTNTPYYNTANTPSTNGNPFQTGMTNQPNTNPGLCRDAA